MANELQALLIKKDVPAWNQWRTENPDIKIDLSGLDLSGLNLTNINLIGANLTSVNLEKTILNTARLEKSKIISSNLKEAKLRGAFLVNANLTDTFLEDADLSTVVLTRAFLRKVKMMNANLSGANLIGANLTRANLTKANVTGANLRGANLYKTNLGEANCTGANLQNAILVETNLDGAILNKCKVYGLSAWGLVGKPKEQSSIIITSENEEEVTVDDLPVAQFIHLLLNRENLRSVINTITSKAVLILGRFTPERKIVLDTIANELRQYNLLPVIFDFERPTNRNLTETIKILAGLSLFVIVDITKPQSSPLELQGIVPDYAIPYIAIKEAGEKQFAMFDDLFKYEWVLPPLLNYNSLDFIKNNFKDVFIDRAFKKSKELEIIKAKQQQSQSVEDFVANLNK